MSHKGKPFRFKQFEIYQEQTAMKVGTDGVLLGAWTKVGSAKTILDVGCGTGLLSLMLAQKSNARITAVEIDQNAFEEAKLNISISPWSNQIELIYTDFEQFDTKSKFDLIICNPPFFKGKAEQSSRSTARQNTFLPFDLLILKSAELLTENGVLSLIVPFEHQSEILKLAESTQLYVNEIVHVKGNKGAPIKRTLLRLSKELKEKIPQKTITIEVERNQFTDEYIELLKPYLLYL
ncbi:MAG: tRNA (adenine-N(6)-)-methyltransferase [Flavobacteriales bacterium]|nr:tRNA (adenine-N(6)-)-methyltransferase [Flavobacteriales bacterium]